MSAQSTTAQSAGIRQTITAAGLISSQLTTAQSAGIRLEKMAAVLMKA